MTPFEQDIRNEAQELVDTRSPEWAMRWLDRMKLFYQHDKAKRSDIQAVINDARVTPYCVTNRNPIMLGVAMACATTRDDLR